MVVNADRPAHPFARMLHGPLLIAVVVVGLSASTPRAAHSADGDPPLRVFASRHYHIHTDLPREQVVPYGRHMDAIYQRYQKRFADFDPRDDKPMPLYLFRTRAAYEAFLDAHGIDAQNSGGMFFVNRSVAGLATWTEGKSRSRTLGVLQHEGFHQFAWRHIGPGVPVWANEGLAQYFEDAILVRGKMTVGLAGSHKVLTVRSAIASGQVVPVADLLAMDGKQWGDTLRDDPARAELLYAQAWSIAYFLIHGDDGRYRAAFGRFLRMVSEGLEAAEAYRRAFGSSDTYSLERAWLRYAEAQETDPLSTAAYRLEFLGAALRFMVEKGEPLPRDMDALRATLTAREFSLTRSSHHVTDTLTATDASLFTYSRTTGAVAEFEMLASSRDDLPPRISAPGISPAPTLIWSRDDAERLVMDIEYR